MKTIVVIAYDKVSADVYAEQVRYFMGDKVRVFPYSTKENFTGIRPADLYLISTCACTELNNFQSRLPPKSEVIIIQVTIRKESLKQLLKIPQGTKALVVNLSHKMAIETMALFNRFGIDNIECYPCSPNETYTPNIGFAVTPGESRYVPEEVTDVLDIGPRLLSGDTVVELLLKSDCEELLEEEKVKQYLKEIAAVNLLTSAGIADILKSFPSVWASFAPIGAVFIATLGLGVANGSGFLKGILSLASNFKSKFIVTMIVVLIGINGNLIGDTAFVVFPPLIAILYINLKRNPLAGLFTAYASVACGFGAALVVGNGDAMLAGMTEAAARLVDPAMVVSPASGYYFMLVSTIVLSPAIAWVSIKFVEKKLDDTGMGSEFELEEDEHIKVSLSPVENKAMKLAALGLGGLVLVLVAMGFKGMPFAPPEGKSFAFSPMLRAIPAVILFVFAVPGYVYGKITGTIKEFKDIFAMMTNEIKTIAPFFLICFFASQFISVFAKSNLGTIIAIKCGLFLKNSGIHGVGLFVVFVFLIAIINLFVSSMSAKWAVLSTVFVPMLLIAGITPAATQMAYRIGDSLTNNITPTFAYLGIILTYAQKYDKRAQTGTVMAYMLPFSIAFTLVWFLLLILWTVSGLPIGPGYNVFM